MLDRIVVRNNKGLFHSNLQVLFCNIASRSILVYQYSYIKSDRGSSFAILCYFYFYYLIIQNGTLLFHYYLNEYNLVFSKNPMLKLNSLLPRYSISILVSMLH